ncbi:MAG: 4'-phosphopantetheinyl transferase superfamily protein [Muribaculaceae bacterium]|nr:4'-phosphopantetheinyl transferase superfamily protein [Muribaculaceae bacterium]
MGEFMYEREVTPSGVAVEMIYGADEKSAKVWKLFAMQIFSEAEGDYREIAHLENGAPVLYGIPQRISVSHTSHCLVVASLQKTPDIDLSSVNPRTALGIDLEKSDRAQVLKIRDKFLSDSERVLLPEIAEIEKATEEDVKQYILAWTCKEALYKADMGMATDWKEDYKIEALPQVASDMQSATSDKFGKGVIKTADGEMNMLLSSWEFEGHVVTLAFSGKIAKYQPIQSQSQRL